MSQCDRVLEVLRDGQWHTIVEIHERAGTMRLNSRIAELRERGHNIVCEKREWWDNTRRRKDWTYAYKRIGSLDAGGTSSPPAPSEPDVGKGLATSDDAGPALAGTGGAASDSLDSYGVDRAVAELNSLFEGMLIELPADGEPLPLALEENRRRLAELQASLFPAEQAAA